MHVFNSYKLDINFYFMNKQITNKNGLKEPKSFSLVRGLQEGSRNKWNPRLG